jgi:hypothetical protein
VKKPPQESADDKLLGKVIAEELRQQLGNADSVCPETEIVAAFYDRSLSDAERQMWEKHFLKCLRCQEYLAELARLADADEPLPILGDESEAQDEQPPAGWFHRLAWVLPVMVIALASAYWYREDVHRYLDRGEAVAMKSQEPALPVPESRPAAAAKLEPERAKGGTDLAKTPAERLERQAKKEEAIRHAPSAPAAAPGAGTEGGMAAPTARREVADAAKSAESMPRRDEETGSRRAEMPPAAAVLPPKTAGEPVAGMGEGKASGFGALTVSGAQQKTVATWRVGRRGTIQKADGEGGWTRVASGVEDDLFDITFAGSTGWVVGHAGLVLRSTDGGKTWQRVPSPTSEDLVRVSSLGAEQASVFTRSGRTYTTRDGGQSWK